jgi:hypothetical protein
MRSENRRAFHFVSYILAQDADGEMSRGTVREATLLNWTLKIVVCFAIVVWGCEHGAPSPLGKRLA